MTKKHSYKNPSKKQVQRLMEDFKTKKTEFVRNEEYPVL